MKTTTTQRPKRPRDLNQLAALTLALATGEAQEHAKDGKKKAASKRPMKKAKD